MTFSVPKKTTVNITTTCRCGLTAATPIEIYEPTYVEALEFENNRLRKDLNWNKLVEELEDVVEMKD